MEKDVVNNRTIEQVINLETRLQIILPAIENYICNNQLT